MIRSISSLLLGLFCLLGFVRSGSASDSLAARIIWIENERLYFNAGTEKGISPGWQFYVDISEAAAGSTYSGVIDRVYADLSVAAAGPLSTIDLHLLAGLPDTYLFPPEKTVPHIAHLRVGLVDTSGVFHLPDNITQHPLISSLFYPWTRSGDLGGLGFDGDSVSPFTTNGLEWTFRIDTARWAGGEFPHGWGALADRLHELIAENDHRGCPTFWALRPLLAGPLDKAGVYFEGFTQLGDTALGLLYATPFYTLPEYINSGWWRRKVAAAWAFDSELDTRTPAWEKSGSRTWVRKAIPTDFTYVPFLVDTITVLPFADYDDQWLAYELGRMDLCLVSIDDLLRIGMNKRDNRFRSAVQNALVVFGVNQQKNDLADNRLTTATSYLVDKLALVRALLADQAVVAHGILDQADAPGESYYPHDPPKGRKILKDLHLRRELNFYVDRRIDRGMTVARHIAGKLNAGGVKTRLISADYEMFADPDYADSMDLFLYLWPADPETPDMTFYSFLYYPGTRCGTNPLAIDDPDFLDLLEKARQEQRPVIRARYYREIEYRLLAEPFICPLYRPIKTIMVSNRLPDIRLTASGEIDIVISGIKIPVGRVDR